jgi:Zn-dependent alcohol dehydrogenase
MKDEDRLIILIYAALFMGIGGVMMLKANPGAALAVFGLTIIGIAFIINHFRNNAHKIPA